MNGFKPNFQIDKMIYFRKQLIRPSSIDLVFGLNFKYFYCLSQADGF